MAKRKITKRWLLNSFGIILLILIAIEILSAYGLKSYYYSGVRQTVVSRADLVLKKYAQDASADYATEVRGLIENFEDKDKMEIMALDMDGNVLLSSSGFEATEKLYMPDFQEALGSETGEGYFQGMLYGENSLALTRISQVSDEEIFAIRYITSLVRVDRQIISLVVIITVLGVAIIFFVVLSSTYFINSIVVPLGKVGQTARKIAQGDFSIRLEKENDDEIGELCDVINYMAGELSKAEQLKNDFISSVSHELRTPLTAIKGWAETLQTGGIGRETYDKGMNVIVREAERLSGMVEELLDFSRMQSGRMRLILKKIDLLAELDEAVYMFTDRARTEHKNLIYDEEDTMLSPILGDVNRLRQVFINVIDNALKYTNPGGTVRVSAYEDDGFIRVIIKDSGCGIPAEHLPNVKKKFYKANQNVRGNGIGLAVANEIMELHSGSLDIDSEEGMGTTVIITIPTMKKLEMNPELSNTTQIPTATAQVQVVERKQD